MAYAWAVLNGIHRKCEIYGVHIYLMGVDRRVSA